MSLQTASAADPSPTQDDGGKTYFFERATEQNNQLRIALLSISLGLCAFFAKDLNRDVTIHSFPFLYATVALSLCAAVSGLLGWKFSASMFHERGTGSKTKRKPEGENESKTISHRLKNGCDIALPLLLALALFAALMHLLYERAPN